MKEYHKIQTVFHRNPETNYKQLMEGTFALPEFDILKDIEWVWTEKVDGTNVRIMWDGVNVRFGGKTDNAQMPTSLLNVLQNTFTPESLGQQFGKIDTDEGKEINVCLYGEGFGAKIQKSGGNYLSNKVDFILFDCKIGKWWLSRESMEQIAMNLKIEIVPIVGKGTLLEAVDLVKNGYKSIISENKEHIAEGLIMKPIIELFNQKEERIISKIKYTDFKR